MASNEKHMRDTGQLSNLSWKAGCKLQSSSSKMFVTSLLDGRTYPYKLTYLFVDIYNYRADYPSVSEGFHELLQKIMFLYPHSSSHLYDTEELIDFFVNNSEHAHDILDKVYVTPNGKTSYWLSVFHFQYYPVVHVGLSTTIKTFILDAIKRICEKNKYVLLEYEMEHSWDENPLIVYEEKVKIEYPKKYALGMYELVIPFYKEPMFPLGRHHVIEKYIKEYIMYKIRTYPRSIRYPSDNIRELCKEWFGGFYMRYPWFTKKIFVICLEELIKPLISHIKSFVCSIWHKYDDIKDILEDRNFLRSLISFDFIHEEALQRMNIHISVGWLCKAFHEMCVQNYNSYYSWGYQKTKTTTSKLQLLYVICGKIGRYKCIEKAIRFVKRYCVNVRRLLIIISKNKSHSLVTIDQAVEQIRTIIKER